MLKQARAFFRHKVKIAANDLRRTVTRDTSFDGYVSRAMFGDKWPLTVEHARINCVGRCGFARILTLVARGKVYALNGVARQVAETQGWSDIREIWADNFEYGDLGLKIDITPLIEHGHKLER